MEAYSEHVPKKNMHVNDKTADDLMKHLQRTSVEVATNTNRWSVHSLRLLPKPICEVLALLLNLVEDVGRWPRPLAEGYISRIPKGEGMQPTNMRPLSVLSAVYRLWAGIRLQAVMNWQEQGIHPHAYGFRTGKGTGDAYILLSTMVELTTLLDEKLYIVGLDYVKCFDRVPQAIILQVAADLGLDPESVEQLGRWASI